MLTTQELRKRLDDVPTYQELDVLCELASQGLVVFTLESRRKGFAMTILTQDGEGESFEAQATDAIYAALEAIDDQNEIVAEVI
jgi:hypothetical protein